MHQLQVADLGGGSCVQPLVVAKSCCPINVLHIQIGERAHLAPPTYDQGRVLQIERSFQKRSLGQNGSMNITHVARSEETVGVLYVLLEVLGLGLVVV